MKKLILFDIDGTLIHAGKAAERAFRRAFEKVYGMDCSKTAVKCAGRSDLAIHRDYVAQVLGRAVSGQESEELKQEYLSNLKLELIDEPDYEVLPGVEFLLKNLDRSSESILGLQTGNFKKAAELKLSCGGLDRYFDFGGFGCDSEDRAELVSMAISRCESLCGLRASELEILLVGDTPADIVAAKRNKCAVIAVATGQFSMDELEREKPQHLFESLAEKELLDLLVE